MRASLEFLRGTLYWKLCEHDCQVSTPCARTPPFGAAPVVAQRALRSTSPQVLARAPRTRWPRSIPSTWTTRALRPCCSSACCTCGKLASARTAQETRSDAEQCLTRILMVIRSESSEISKGHAAIANIKEHAWFELFFECRTILLAAFIF